MVAAKGSKSLLTTSSRITGSECPHAQLLQVLKAETQVDIESRYVKKKIQFEVKNPKSHLGGGRNKLPTGSEDPTKDGT